ncbi:hypothetical protein D3C80_1453160 [compost metagenome]
MLAGLESPGRTRQGFTAITQYQFLESVIGARPVIPGIQVHWPADATELFPGGRFTAEDLCQLVGVQLGQWIVRVKDNGQAIDGDHMLGVGGFQVAKGLEVHPFAVLDWARGSSQVGAGVVQGNKAGAGAVGGDIHAHLATFSCLADNPLLVVARGFTVDLEQALLVHQAFDQCRGQGGADGVGALDTQGRALLGYRQLAGVGREWLQAAEQQR